MSIRSGDVAPDFSATTAGGTIDFHECPETPGAWSFRILPTTPRSALPILMNKFIGP